MQSPGPAAVPAIRQIRMQECQETKMEEQAKKKMSWREGERREGRRGGSEYTYW